MKSKIYLLDFNDSFTYNIYSLLVELSFDVEIINWKNLTKIKPKSSERCGVVYGPGPGDVNEYNCIKDVLGLMQNKSVFHMGICLGHQLLGVVLGGSIVNAHSVIHGDKVELCLDQFWREQLGIDSTSRVYVQRYNSLALKIELPSLKPTQVFTQDGECLMIRSERIFSVQFHPDSIGTTFPHAFFSPMQQFLLK